VLLEESKLLLEELLIPSAVQEGENTLLVRAVTADKVRNIIEE
jgi:hypothetical protein